ncbi:S8 family serine peptidase [Leucobacter japonicus]|uniref:S8 family serine peptidase n=1 Tax=Leucobacter japonicus TaxID=1461259 RepID=UPI0006A76F57|nr:S8 family serine peptidase [Leucobacter japonicus]
MVIRRVAATALAVLMGFGAMLLGSSAAQASMTDDERATALWYTERLKFDQIREQGLTGEGITIAVIDDAINLDAAELQGADVEVRGQFCRDRATGEEFLPTTDDPARAHGTSVVSMLVGNGVAADGGAGTQGIVPDARVLFYAVDGPTDESGAATCDGYNPITQEFGSDEKFDLNAEDYDSETDVSIDYSMAVAAKQAIADGADIISVSSVSSVWSMLSWSPVATLALRAGIPIVAGTLNPDGTTADILQLLPAVLNGTVAVGGVDYQGEPITGIDPTTGDLQTQRGVDNMGFSGPAYQLLGPSDGTSWAAGTVSGSSVATPLVAGTIALGLEKYPDASANQVLQAMVRTTGKGILQDPGWLDRLYGYGIVNPVAMLQQDPTQYPDENPLFVKSSDDPRCGSGATSQPTPDLANCAWATVPMADRVWPDGSDDEPSSFDRTTMFMLAVVGLPILGVAATAIIVPIVVTRSRRRNTRPSLTSANVSEYEK